MAEQQSHSSADYQTRYLALNKVWAELCQRYLPVAPSRSIWRHSRELQADDPEQGWKLHLPATVLSANRVLETVGPLLRNYGVLYKAPATLTELDKLNSGIFYGYSQVGKFLTVYPRTSEEAVQLANHLHKLTRRMPAPAVPFDLKYCPDGCVYYRYGAFRVLEVSGRDGESSYAIRDPAGNLTTDARDSVAGKPDWVTDLFPRKRERRKLSSVETPLKTTFRVFRALAQRGKGGVYQALDLSATPPRLCILKEGRKNGEVSWDGRDGFWRVKYEGPVLGALCDAGVNVPRVYASFKAEKNYYLALEFIEGESLAEWLRRKRRRLAVGIALKRATELARLISQIHAAGWVWRDCKPGNIIITKSGELRPLDFEGACPVDRADPLPWGTPSYIPPEMNQPFTGQSRLPEDLYALGAMIYLLLAGCPPDDSASVSLKSLRRNIPAGVIQIVKELLSPDPSQRPAAQAAARRLETVRVRMKHRAVIGRDSSVGRGR